MALNSTPSTGGKRLIIAEPHGFCSGVARAVKTADLVLSSPHHPVFCLHEIVHNRQIADALSRRGMVFVKTVDEVPSGGKLLFSAHGVSPAVRLAAAERDIECIDATCPFVNRVHETVRRSAAQKHNVICIGHRDHDEVVGICGEADGVVVVESEEEAAALNPSPGKTTVVSQTTMEAGKVAAICNLLKKKIPELETSEAAGVCYATKDRQEAVRKLADEVQNIIVLGSINSSNTLRLAETARNAGARAHLVSSVEELNPVMETIDTDLGITSGASTPEEFLSSIVRLLVHKFGYTLVENEACAKERR